jgi:pyrroloquinoline quinone (PQQ) biosynthesis protein C
MNCLLLSQLCTFENRNAKEIQRLRRPSVKHEGIEMIAQAEPLHASDARLSPFFEEAMRCFLETKSVRKLLSEGWSKREYGSYFSEVYHYTKEDPQLQALATVFFRGPERRLVKTFLQHAISEVGHDQLALNDAAKVGVERGKVEESVPLPATIAFTSYGFYEIYNRRPVGYLGYLYFLEHLGTSHGKLFGEAFAKSGIPKDAMSFLFEHTTADIGHNRLMLQYLAALVRSERDWAEVGYAIRVTGNLYGLLVDQSIERANDPARFDYGLDVTEQI